MQVAIRLRPPQSEDICISKSGQTQLVDREGIQYAFDQVFDVSATQEVVYEQVKPLLQSVFEGYNTSIITYGNTGTGKTYTLFGGVDDSTNNEHMGILARLSQDLFQLIQQKESEESTALYKVHVQFLEIYGDDINDLLDTRDHVNKVTIRDVNGDVIINGAKEEIVCSSEQLLSAIEYGNIKRHTSSTILNKTSSRSHAIFTIVVKKYIYLPDTVTAESSDGALDVEPNYVAPSLSMSAEVITSKLHFCDLAGSERLKRTHSVGKKLHEGIDINLGLLALGNVISILGDAQKKNKIHIPYRDSKLTRILKDSLGGNSRTLLLCCVSCDAIDYPETVNALKYARKAKNITNKPTINRDPTVVFIEELKLLLARVSVELLHNKMNSNEPNDRENASAFTLQQLEMLSSAAIIPDNKPDVSSHSNERRPSTLRRSSTSNQQIEQIYQETSNLPTPIPITASETTSNNALQHKINKLPIAESVYVKAAAVYQSHQGDEGDNSHLLQQISDLTLANSNLRDELETCQENLAFTKKEKERIRVNLMNKYDEIVEQEGAIEFLKIELENAKESAASMNTEKERCAKVIEDLRHSYQAVEVQLAVLKSNSNSVINELENSIDALREENKLLREIREMDTDKIKRLDDKIESIQYSMVVLERELNYTITSGSDDTEECSGEGKTYSNNTDEPSILNYSSPFVTNPLQPYESTDDHASMGVDPINTSAKLSHILQKVLSKLSCFNQGIAENILGESKNAPDPAVTKKASDEGIYDNAALSKELIDCKIKMANMDIEHEELKSNYRRLEHVVCSLKLEIAVVQAEVDERAEE